MTKNKGRPPYFLFDPSAWKTSPSVKNMTMEQAGWYWSLLAEAWLNDPQATLPNDDKMLKEHIRFQQTIAEQQKIFDDIRAQLELALNLLEGQTLTKELIMNKLDFIMAHPFSRFLARLETRFKDVKKNFRTSGSDPNLLYNERQLHELSRWLEGLKSKADAGKNGAVKRWGVTAEKAIQEREEVDPMDPHPLLNGTPKVQNSGPIIQNGIPILNPTIKMADPFSSMGVPLNPTNTIEELNNHVNSNTKNITTNNVDNINNLVYNKNIVNKVVDSNIRTPSIEDQSEEKKDETKGEKSENKSSGKQKTATVNPRETLFDENRFKLTDKMTVHLQTKHPDFVQGDYDYLVEKFKMVYHGKRYVSWSRTFYNFVVNQITLYNYSPGLYTKLERSTTNSEQRRPSTETRHYESAAERNARLDRENEEYTKHLLGEDSRVDTSDSETLPLGSSDVRDP